MCAHRRRVQLEKDVGFVDDTLDDLVDDEMVEKGNSSSDDADEITNGGLLRRHNSPPAYFDTFHKNNVDSSQFIQPTQPLLKMSNENNENEKNGDSETRIEMENMENDKKLSKSKGDREKDGQLVMGKKTALVGREDTLGRNGGVNIVPSPDPPNDEPTTPPTPTKFPVLPKPEELETFANQQKRKKAKRYYQRQASLVKDFQEDSAFVQKFTEDESEVIREQKDTVERSDDILAKVSLAANLCLLAAKCIAAALSGSLAVIGSVVDSATDITSGLVIYLTNRAIVKRDIYAYPRGRTRLQPVALVIISVIMGACSVQVISKSIESMARGEMNVDVELPTIIIMVATIVIKFTLMVVCYMYRSPSCAVLAQDHRNDTISNTVAIVCAYLATKFWVYLDPIAAIVVSCYILITWLRTGNEHVKALSGKAAKPEFINRIIKICLDHRPELKQIDTVLAYHYGTKYLVEIDVVLDEHLSLKDAHDIAEPLQRKIEYLPDVERAFVHIDYETEHRPDYEHKVV